jgi:hypothetical protein
MGADADRLMTKAEYAKHRGVSRPYISKLAKNGILVMRGGKIDVAATDTVLDDRPVDDVNVAPASGTAAAARPVTEPSGQSGASFGQARTIEMVFRAKLRRLEFETKQGKLIEAEVYRKAVADAFRNFRDGMLGIPDRLATVIAAESDPKKVHLALKTEIARQLEAASSAVLAL